jgi:cysteine synthase
MIEKAKSFAQSPDTYFTDQFNNRDAILGYRDIGVELLQQVNRPIDAFCGGVGTAGMLMGVSQELRLANPNVRIIALEPASAAIISTGTPGTHHVEGVGVGFVPPLLDVDLYDQARGIDEQEARQMARLLAKEEGIFAGTSSGLNVVGALQLAAELGEGNTVVTVAVDTGLKYLADDLFAL